VRRDLADVFCTTAEGVKGRRAVDWGLVDEAVPRSRFDHAVLKAARDLAEQSPTRSGPGVPLGPLAPEVSDTKVRYRHVELTVDPERRLGRLLVRGPEGPPPETAAEARAAGAELWPLACFREIDDALLRLRFHHETVGVVLIETAGDPERVRAWDAALARLGDDWFVREVVLKMGRVLRRLDLTARSFFAVLGPGSCFAGSLYELSLAADRSYLLDDPARPVTVALGPLNGGKLPMSHGPSRLAVRFLGEPGKAEQLLAHKEPFDPPQAREQGLVTVVADDIDFDDELRIAIEERSSLSPDALTGMEASLRFPGAENMDSKVFGRLSAWQNWIFQRPNAVGERGALSMYGQPEQPAFDYRRT
jgi:benzoyl-CoA-dihydrodiol lyase